MCFHCNTNSVAVFYYAFSEGLRCFLSLSEVSCAMQSLCYKNDTKYRNTSQRNTVQIVKYRNIWWHCIVMQTLYKFMHATFINFMLDMSGMECVECHSLFHCTVQVVVDCTTRQVWMWHCLFILCLYIMNALMHVKHFVKVWVQKKSSDTVIISKTIFAFFPALF